MHKLEKIRIFINKSLTEIKQAKYGDIDNKNEEIMHHDKFLIQHFKLNNEEKIKLIESMNEKI